MGAAKYAIPMPSLVEAESIVTGRNIGVWYAPTKTVVKEPQEDTTVRVLL